MDYSGNVIAPDNSHTFTTEPEPLTPYVNPNSLTINQGNSASLTITFGQGIAAASGASITVSNMAVASVSTTSVAAPGTISVYGHSAGTADITVTFNDTAGTVITVPVTVLPVAPVPVYNPPAPPEPDLPEVVSLNITPVINKRGKAYLTIPLQTIKDAIVSRTSAGGLQSGGIILSMAVQNMANAKSLEIIIPRDDLWSLLMPEYTSLSWTAACYP